MKNIIKGGAIILLTVVITGGFIYGSYWVAKKMSYKWWYEDMVKQTITEMVKPEALK